MGVALDTLEKFIKKMAGTLDEKHSRIITKFYSGYKDEILKHFEYEESVVFPYIKMLDEGKLPDNYSIDLYEESHSDVDEKLNDLKSIVMKYMPETCDDNLIQNVLTCLYTLENDLSKHTYIEDELLVPMAESREKYLRKQMDSSVTDETEMREPIRKILILEPSVLIAEGLRHVIDNFAGYDVCGIIRNQEGDIWAKIDDFNADLVIADPSVFDNRDRAGAHDMIKGIANAPVMALISAAADAAYASTYDGTIYLSDTSDDIEQESLQS